MAKEKSRIFSRSETEVRHEMDSHRLHKEVDKLKTRQIPDEDFSYIHDPNNLKSFEDQPSFFSNSHSTNLNGFLG